MSEFGKLDAQMRAAKRAALSEHQAKGKIVVDGERWSFQAVPVSDEEWRIRLGDLLEFDQFECSVCHALLKGGICLNGCHLGPSGREQFRRNMADFVERAKKEIERGHD